MSGKNELKKLVLIVTGGIAAYKSAELVRLLTKKNFQVKVIMTKSATHFIQPLTFQALTGFPALTDESDSQDNSGMDHIELSRWADAVIIAPATANFLAQLRLGLAHSHALSFCLAWNKTIFFAPAMNQGMWANPATQENINILISRNHVMLGPVKGQQACGDFGPGRMMEPNQLVEAMLHQEHKNLFLDGLNILITAGPTREFLDPVRYLSNRSSGKMGYALAQAAVNCGASVTLISGPVCLDPPPSILFCSVDTAEQMLASCLEKIDQIDIFISVAAVADYKVKQPSPIKIKKKNGNLKLELLANPDILNSVATLPNPPFCVGFAAETQNLEFYAKEKLRSKNIDMICANQIDWNLGIESDTNACHVFWNGGEQLFPEQSKITLAYRLLELIKRKYYQSAKNLRRRSVEESSVKNT